MLSLGRTITSFALLFLLAACGSPVADSLVASDLDHIINDYQSLVKVTEQPHRFSSIGVMILCRLPTAIEQQMVDSPHGNLEQLGTPEDFPTVLLNVYLSQAAVPIFQQLGTATVKFPAGTIIVKEKLTEQDRQLEALGIMLKREAGYNPAAGDWEYAYWESGKLTRDAALLQGCQDCHLSQKQSDSVFGLDQYGGEYPYVEASQ